MRPNLPENGLILESRTMQRSAAFSRLLHPLLALTAAAFAAAAPAYAQVEGNVFPPTLSYAPTPGTPINLSGVTVIGSSGSAQISVIPSGGMGGGSFSMIGLNCTYTGADAAAFNVAPASQTFGPTSAPGSLGLSCTSGSTARNATLQCAELPGGSTGQVRNWPVTCPAGTPPTPPSLSYAPTPGSTINFQPVGGLVGTSASAQIRVTPSGGSAGSGLAVTTRLQDCALSSETVPGTFSGFQNPLTFVGATTTPQNLNLSALVRSTQVTATLTCQEVRGIPDAPDGNVFQRSWQLQVAPGASPAQLRLSKSVSAPQVVTGSEFSYTIEVSNAGSSGESALVVIDDVPSTLTVLSASGSGWNCSVIGNAVDCRRGSLVQGASSSFQINVRAPSSPRVISNSARLTSQSTSTAVVASVSVEIVAPPANLVDLTIDKRDSADPVAVNSTFSYFLDVANIGDHAAAGVVVSDALPAGVTLVAATGAGWSCSGAATVSCSLAGSLAAGSASTIELQVRAPAQATELSNTANVSSADIDLNSNNNSDTETTAVNDNVPPPPPSADLAISAQAVPASALTGQGVELLIGVNNLGPDAATTTSVSGTLSAAFAIAGAAGNGWTCNVANQQVQCTRPGLAVNAASEIRVQTTIRPGATATAEATFAVSSPVADPVTGNNTARVVVAYQPGGADLAIVKTDSADPVTAAAQFNYTLTVSNAGPEAATGVRITDALPSALTFVSASGAGFTCTRSGQTVSCDLAGTLAAGATAAVTIAVRAPTTAQSISNEGVVSSSSSDPNPANNRSTQSTQISNRTAADLAALLDDAAIDPASQAALPVVADECAIATSALADACRGIIDSADQGRTSEVTEALRAIAPDEVLAQTMLLREIGATQFFNVDSRLNELRRGGGGFSLAGLTVNQGQQSIPLALVGEALQSALGFGEDYGLTSPWGFFINGNFTSGEQDQNIDDGRVGVDYDSIGITAGVDYRLSPRAVVGGAIGYADLSSDLSGDSTLDAQSLLFTGYGSYYLNDRLYVDSRLTYGSVDLDQSRKIQFQTGATAFDETAIGQTDGTQLTLATSIGYHLNYGAWSVTPNAGLRYISNDTDAFDETGADEFNVGYAEQSFSTLQYGVGVQVARAVSLSSGVLMPQFDFSLNGENSDDPEAQARLLNGSSSQVFRLQEENLDSSYGTAGLGFVYLMGNGKQAFMYYRTTFGNDDLDRGTLNLGGRFEF
jgi:uncharacterized repeat protein (TIGR01451 family)